MILMIERDGSYTVLRDSQESVSEMIANWLASDRRELGYDDEDAAIYAGEMR